MQVASDQPRRFFSGRNYDVQMVVAPLAGKSDGRHQDQCSVCGRPVLSPNPLPPKKALRRPPTKKAAISFSTADVTCIKCAPDFSPSTN
jgi:hypothetical protein